MKKTILVLLALLLAVTTVLLIAACTPTEPQDPCQNGHAWDNGTVTVKATCQVEGKVLKRCKKCGTTQEETVAKLPHNWDPQNVVQEPTCSTPGIGSAKCTECGAETNEYQIPTIDHTWGDPSVTKAATCTQTGENTFTCTVCGETRTEEIPMTEHNWGEPQVEKAPTCTEPGLGSVTCRDCTAHKEDYAIPATGHSVGTQHPQVDPTCQTFGTAAYYDCANECGVKLNAQGQVVTDASLQLAKLRHSYNDGVVTKEPTCTDAGERTFTCQNEGCQGDGHTFTQTIPAKGHSYGRLVPAEATTCEKDGHDAYYYCDVCHTYFDSARSETTLETLTHKAPGHHWETLPAKEATCTQTGLTEGVACDVCGQVKTAQQTVGKKPHTPQTVKGTPATCEAAGTSDGQVCQVCGTTLTAQKVVSALGHKYSVQWDWGEGNETATAVFTCSNDGCPRPKVEVEATVVVNEHVDDVTYVATAFGPDGLSHTAQQVVRQEHKHEYYVVDWTWSENCETASVTVDCRVCNKLRTTETAKVTKNETPATCTEQGQIEFTATATVFGEQWTNTQTQTLQPKGHQKGEFHPAELPTCTEDGTKEYYDCANGCGSKLDAEGNVMQSVSDPATGHDYDRTKYVNNGADGHGYKCTRCGELEKVISHGELKYDNDENQHWQYCPDCDYETTQEDHEYKNWQHDKDKQTHTGTCACGATKTENCTNTDSTCPRCGHVYNDGKEEVTIHLHLPDGWTKAYLWAWSTKDGDLFTGVTDPKREMKSDEIEGWVVIKVRYTVGVLREFKFTSALSWTNETANTSSTSNEIWCSNKGSAFASMEDALADEAIAPPQDNDWFVVGTHTGGSPKTSTWDYAFGKMGDNDHYTVEIHFNQNDWFKIKKNNDGWDDVISYSSTKWTISAAAGISGTPKNMLASGENDNFVVQAECTLQFTFNPSNQTVKIVILSGKIPGGSTGGNKELVLTGGGQSKLGNWTDVATNKLVWDGNAYKITFDFLKDDVWKIKYYNDSSWAKGSLGYANLGTISKNGDFDGDVKGLFGVDGENVKVLFNCKVVIKVNEAFNKIDIEVLSATGLVTYTYNFYFYSTRNVSKMQVHAFQKGSYKGDLTAWDATTTSNGLMTKVSGTNWWKWSYVSGVKLDGREIGVIFHNGGTKYLYVNDENHTTKIYIATDMFFVEGTYTKYFKSAEEAGHPLTAHTHNYELTSWQWDGVSKATATFTCNGSTGTCQAKTVTVDATGENIKLGNRVEATCAKDGVQYYTATVTGPDNKQYTTDEANYGKETLAKTGHTYGEPVWGEWVEKNGEWTVTVKFVCSKCEDDEDGHELTPEVNITSDVQTAIDCKAGGKVVWTATVNVEFGDKEYSITKEVETPALGHKYRPEGDLNWTKNYTEAELRLVCIVCTEETERHSITIKFSVEDNDIKVETTSGSCTTAGQTTYTLTVDQKMAQSKLTSPDTVTFDQGKTYKITGESDKQEVIGHNWQVKENGVQWATEANENGELTATVTLVCINDQCVVKTVVLTFNVKGVVTDPTCVDQGFTTYTLNVSAVDVQAAAKKKLGENISEKDTYPGIKGEGEPYVHKTDVKLPTGIHEYDMSKYVSCGENGHGHKCKHCDAFDAIVDHTFGNWQHDEGAETHTGTCACSETKTEGCTHTDSKCPTCGYVYNGYVVVGQGSIFGNGWEELESNLFQESGPTDQSPNYYIKLVLKQDDQFKVKKWKKDWNDCFGFGDKIYFDMSAVNVSESVLFSAGNDGDGKPNDNIKVLVDCTVYLTIYKDNLSKMKIYVESVQGTIPETETNYFLVGKFSGVEHWNDQTGYKMKYNADDKTYSIEHSFAVGDAWKVKMADSYSGANDNWAYGINGADLVKQVTIKWGSLTKPDVALLDGGDNIIVNHKCTLTIVYDPAEDLTTITVTAFEENKITYNYTLHLYAPVDSGWNQPCIWAWDGPFVTDSGDPSQHPMLKDTENEGWWYFEVKNSAIAPNTKQCVIFVNRNWDSNQRIDFGSTEPVHADPVTLKGEHTYFQVKAMKQYDSAEAAVAAYNGVSISSAPQQVAVLPQIVCKERLAA